MADWDEKKKQDWTTSEHVEDADIKAVDISYDLAALSAIEDTAASTAAWLIAVTVSLGSFLFGMMPLPVPTYQ